MLTETVLMMAMLLYRSCEKDNKTELMFRSDINPPSSRERNFSKCFMTLTIIQINTKQHTASLVIYGFKHNGNTDVCFSVQQQDLDEL